MSNEWLQNLKPGDKVIRRSASIGAIDHVETVTRVTPSQLIVAGIRYKKSNGHNI